MELSVSEIKRRIYAVRGHKVVLDNDLAEFYQTQTRVLNQAVQRNRDRFPPDFMFKLTLEESKDLEIHIVSSSLKHGGRRFVPYAFTEHGVAMLSSVLDNGRAVQVNIAIMRSFAEVRQLSGIGIESREKLDEIETRLEQLEQKQDGQFKMILSGIQQLLMEKSSNNAPALSVLHKPTTVDVDDRFSHPQEQDAFGSNDKLKAKEMGDLIHGKKVHSKINSIHQTVAKYFGLRVQDLKAPSRVREVVLPRQIAIYLVRKHTGIGFKEIGKSFGGKDHSTVMHAYNKIATAIERDNSVCETVEIIQKLLFAL